MKAYTRRWILIPLLLLLLALFSTFSPSAGEMNLNFLIAQKTGNVETKVKTKAKETTHDKDRALKKLRILKVEVQGNRFVPEHMILEAVDLKLGEPISREDISKALNRVYSLGYFADVDAGLRPYKDGYVLVIKVAENPVVKKIVFIGNKLLSRGELLELMDTRPGKLLNFKVLREDIQRINKEYNSRGLIGVINHVEDMRITENGVLYIKIKEGLMVKEVKVEGNTVIPTDKIMKLVRIKPGHYLRKQDLDLTMKAIANLYKEAGYLLLDIRTVPSEDGVVHLKILEGVLEDIEVKGLKKTKPYVVKEQIELVKGKVINLNYLKRSLRNLSFSGLFKNVSIDFKAGSKPGRVILVVKVLEEPKTGQLVLSAALAGASGSNRGGLAGALSVSELNYKGKGQRLFLQWQRGDYIKQLNFSFWDPYSAPGNVIWGFSYFDTEYSLQRVPIPGVTPTQWAYYTDKRRGFSISYGNRNIERRSRWLLTLSRYHVDTIPSADAPPSVNRYMISGNIGSLTLSYTVDTRDDEFMPFSGKYDSYSVEYANKLLGDFSYTKFQMELRRYWKSGKRNVIAARLLAGWASDNTPITSMFVMGGADTLRAYPYNSFIGTKLFLVSLEYRFPLFKKESQFYGAVFADYGNTFLPEEKFSFSNMKLDYGFGVLFSMPALGLIRLDYAMSDEDRRVVIRVGQSF